MFVCYFDKSSHFFIKQNALLETKAHDALLKFKQKVEVKGDVSWNSVCNTLHYTSELAAFVLVYRLVTELTL